MNPIDAIARPFIERDFRTPYIDKAIERSRKRREKKRKDARNEILQNRR